MARRFTYRYVLAVVLFATFAILWKTTGDASDQRVRELSQQLDKATTQPTRLDRIDELALKVTNQNASSDRQQIDNWSSELEQESTQLEKIQDGLLNGDIQLNLPKTTLTPELTQLYTDGERLTQTIRTISNAGSLIANLRENTDANKQSRVEQYQSISAAQADALKGTQRAVTLYSAQIEREIRSSENTTQVLLILSGLVALGMVFFLFRPMARSIHFETTQLEDAERNHRENNERQTFRNELSQALEVTDSEDEVLAAVGRAVVAVIPDNPAELFLADASHTRLRREQSSPTQGPAGCPVESPMGCAAIRRGQTVVYESSRMLNVCPKLPQHDAGVCSAVCVPVMFMGSALGVLHTVGPDGHPPDHTSIERLTVMASETGNRLGFLRTQDVTKMQADTDGLTGLLNRRSLEERARELSLDSEQFSVAMADLDHFKSLNDTHGHEAGDRALRQFAAMLSNNLRPDDIACRWGGEEFVLLLPHTSINEAHRAIERLQANLADDIKSAQGILFTASWGLTDNTAGRTFEEIMAAADVMLYEAKRNGRDCIMVDAVAAKGAGMTLDADALVEAEPGDSGNALRDATKRAVLEFDRTLVDVELGDSKGTSGS